jgi:hypothetical protein
LSVHFIYHVPKCAGRTIHFHLAAELGAGAYLRVSKHRRVGDKADEVLDRNQVRALCGHFLDLTTEAQFRGRELKRSILLRDPVSHSVSYYNFRMMRYLSQGLNPYSFDLAYRATQRNFITHYILKNFLELSWYRIALLSDVEKYDLVNAFLGTFWYVADYRLCDDLVAALGSNLGIGCGASRQNTRLEWERRIPWRSLTLDDFSPQLVDQIRQENLLDQKLWETWRQAKHDTKAVRPQPLDRSQRGFLASEAQRLVAQIIRRVRRRAVTFAPEVESELAVS